MDLYKFRNQLTRYLKGKTNETENAIIEAWYKSYPTSDKNLLGDGERERVRTAIQVNIQKAINKPVSSFGVYYRIAATVLIAVSTALLFYVRLNKSSRQSQEFTTIATLAGQVKQVLLPDSTLLWVNAASRVRVPSTFNGSVREVYLDEGEAFFEVKHNVHKPFVVHVAALKVQVLGTSFNINAYRSLPALKVSVATGKVAVSSGNSRLSFLTPGQELSFNRSSGLHHIQNINISQIQSWKTGDTYLNQASFDELALVFKTLFNLTLKAGSKQVNTYHFTLRVHKSLPAEETLKAISLMHNTHYRKEGDQVVLY